jgi:hypothetical protein
LRLLTGCDQPQKLGKTPARGCFRGRVAGLIQIHREHDVEMFRLFLSEFDISYAGISQASKRVMRLSRGGTHGGGEAIKPAFGNGGEKVLFLAKVAIGGRVRDTRAPGHFAKSKFANSFFTDQHKRGFQQRVPEIAMVVRFTIRHKISIAENMLTAETLFR